MVFNWLFKFRVAFHSYDAKEEEDEDSMAKIILGSSCDLKFTLLFVFAF